MTVKYNVIARGKPGDPSAPTRHVELSNWTC